MPYIVVTPSNEEELAEFLSTAFAKNSSADPRPYSSNNDFLVYVVGWNSNGDIVLTIIP